MEIMTAEEAILKGKAEFEALVQAVTQAPDSKTTMHQMERNIWDGILGLGNTLLQVFVARQGTGDLGEAFTFEGQELKRLPRLHRRRYVSVFGPLAILRTVYGTRETQKHEVIPLDAMLGLPDGEFSYLLQDWDQAFCVQGSYSQAEATVERVLGLGQSVRSLEHMNRSMAEGVEGFRAAQPPSTVTDKGSLLVLTADGKGVPIRKEVGEQRRRVRLKPGEKPNKKREACVGAVYEIAPFVRTPEDVVLDVQRKERQADRPKPQNKEVRAEMTLEIEGQEVKGKDRIFSWFTQEVQARDPQGQCPLVCVMDGDRGLWRQLKAQILNAVPILDLFHVMERLWVAAHCFYPEGSKEAEQFVTAKLREVLKGKAGRVIGGLKQMATKRRLSAWRRKQLFTALVYLKNNLAFMRYDEYLAKGYPIGSGVAEGACRHVVKDRMELTGMRWRVEGAQSMLDLRAVYLNGQWEAFQHYRAQHEPERLYPYRSEVINIMRSSA